MKWTIPKRTGTYADSLEAIGKASLLQDLGLRKVSIRDKGICFELEGADEQLPEGWTTPGPGFRYVWESSKEKERPLWPHLDYEAEKAIRDAARKTSKSVDKAAREAGLDDIAKPSPDLGTAVMLSSMRKGWDGDRQLARWLYGNPEKARVWVERGLEGAAYEEAPEVSNTQILNPAAGKGVHAAKTRLKSPGSLPGGLVEPFAEWMKLRGLWRGMLLLRSGDDFKFFVLEPADAEVEGIERVRTALAGLNLWGGIRLDIQMTLRCVEVMIDESEYMREGGRQWLRRRTPRGVIQGLRLAYFKSLGTAAALMNEALLPLPDWFAIENRDDALTYLEIIRESIGDAEKGGCLSTLRDDRSDEGGILQQYREWLLSGELYELLEFHAQFAVHLMERLGRGEFAREYRTEVLDKLLTKSYGEYPVKEIIENEGFQSVARAMRNTTVYALRLPNSRREVQFGLAQRWKQKIKSGKAAFVAELAQFIQEQNWEVAHRLGGKGHTVSTDDMDGVVGLVEAHGAELVGSLLLAYGYSRAPKTQVEGEEEKA